MLNPSPQQTEDQVMEYHVNFNPIFLPLLHFLLLLFSCVGDGLSSNVVKLTCLEEERQVLLSFKQDLVDPSGRLSSWVGHACCQWQGISCNNKMGHVDKMDLRNTYPDTHLEVWNNPEYKQSCLKGKINPSLIGLKHLSYLDLSYNDFQGLPLPEFIGQLKNLRYLNLSYASFQGDVPSSLGNLSKLNHLDLESDINDLLYSKNLDWLSHFSSLKYLNLGGVNLSNTGVSWLHDVSMLPSLLELHLSDCQIDGSLLHMLSPNTINFTSLLVLDMSSNNLDSTFPIWLLNLITRSLKSLEYLDLSSMGLQGLVPHFLGQLSQLFHLDLSGNSWEGILTEAHFINLTRLESLEIGTDRPALSSSLIFNVSDHWLPPFNLSLVTIQNCKVGPGFPPWLRSQTQLVVVVLDNTGISGRIPEEWLLKISSHVSSLHLPNNDIGGELPFQFKYSRLTVMDFSHNQFEGTLQCSPTTAPLLEYLYLSDNHLNGTIPSSICQLQYMRVLSLRNNQFSGKFPQEWSLWSNIDVVDISNNNLSGNIPSSTGIPSSLGILKMNNNHFEGEIPSSLQSCQFLVDIDLSSNNLTGILPVWMGSKLSQLQVLQLRFNFLSGSIPQQWCNLQNLHILDLSNNNISGTIPTCLSNLTALRSFAPPWGFFGGYDELTTVVMKGRELEYSSDHALDLVESVDLSSNNLEGEIPEDMSSLVGLCSLNLSRNLLTGKIPWKFGNLTELETLDLSYNRLTREIPQSISSLTSLSHFNLSYNNLSGRIPSGFQLQTLDNSSYIENPLLCGYPLSTECQGDDTNPTFPRGDSEDEDDNGKLGFYISMVLGFVIGFWGVCGTLVIKKSWRYAYFQFFDSIKDKIAVAITLKIAHLQRRL